jgi:tetratricopeptide (TPR) repeat protein
MLVGLAWFGVNRWQVRRHAAELLNQADAAEAQQRPDRAARFVGLYVGLVPGETEARTRYGRLLDRLAADSPRAREGALAVFEQVLLREPGRHDVRTRAATLAIELSHFDDAVQHLTILSADRPDDGEVRELFGLACEGRGEFARAAGHYRAALAAAPGRIKSYLHLARLLRGRQAQPAEAEAVLEKMVKANDKSYEAYLGRARFRLEGTPSAEATQAAGADVKAALRLAPQVVEVLLAAGELSAQLPGGLEDARGHLRAVVERYPHDVRGYEALARVELAAGRPQEAVRAFRRGLAKLADHPGLSWNLINLLIQQGEVAEAETLLGRLGKLDLPRPRLDYLRAALVLRRDGPVAGRRDLEAVRPLITDSHELLIQCDLLLAECAERVGELETEVLICRRALSIDGRQSGARLRLAGALLQLGRAEEALGECQRMMAFPAPPPAGWPLLARLLIRQNLNLPAGQQRWEDVERVLGNAAANQDPAEAALLRAEVLVARKETAGAHEALAKARRDQPKKGELWVASVDLAVRDGKPKLAQKILQDAERQLGDGASLRLARLRALLGGGTAGQSQKSLATLEEGLDRLTAEDQGRVLTALAEAHFQAGRTTEALRLWGEVARVRPNDLDARLRAFDLALHAEDEAGMEEALAAIRRLEGEGGTLGRYDEARRLIWRAFHGHKDGLARAREELAAVSKRRPGWSRVPLCLGQVWDAEGNEERALEQYLRAIEFGERQLDMIRRVIRLLHDRGRYTEAEMVLRRLPEQTLAFGDLPRLVAEISFRSGNYTRALEVARRAVQADSRDYRDYVWLGQVLWAAAQQAEVAPDQRRAAEAEAEQALSRGVELGGKKPEAWLAFVEYLARTGRREKAEALLEKARGQLPPEQAPLALGQGYAALNRPDKAREAFAQARAARPKDPTVLRVAAAFYLQANDLPAAEECLRKILELGGRDRSGSSWASSLLAIILAARGTDQQSREALKLVSRGPEDAGEDVDRERARAAVLAMRQGRAEHQEAIEILEHIGARQPLSSEDRFLLVQLYERVGNYPKARDRMLPLLKTGKARYLAHHVNALLQQGMAAEAVVWLAELEKAEPAALRTAFLKARLLKAQGRGAEAAPLLKRQAQGQDAPTLLGIAVLLEEVGCGADALELYEKHAGMAKRPEAVFPWARCLARQNQLDRALELCERAWEGCPPRAVAEATLDVLHAAHPGEAQYERVERRLKMVLDMQPGETGLVLCLANLHELRGRFQEAEALYRRVLERDPRSAVALNNLAWILALRDGKGEEALAQVGRAVEVLGPIPELLDTRAVASLAAGRTDAAVEDLTQALARPNLDPKVRFSITVHLAQAHRRAGNEALAKKAWQDAHAAGTRVDALHGLEREGYENLARELGRP